MLLQDNNNYISKIYFKSIDLHRLKQGQYYNRRQANQNIEGQEQEENEDEIWERTEYKCKNEAKQYYKQVYKEFKLQKAHDVYMFMDKQQLNQKLLTHSENYISYPRKQILREAIQQVMRYQEDNNLVDYHPNVNDLNGEIKAIVDKEMEKFQPKPKRKRKKVQKEEKQQNNLDIVRIKNIIHQSLQPYNKLFCNSPKSEEIKAYFKRQSENSGLDQWGKNNRVSPSEFLWLPTSFVFSEKSNMYEIQGKLFHPLENYPELPKLKEELGHLMTYFSDPLKQVHEYFKLLHYKLWHDFKDFDDGKKYLDVKQSVDFSERIHAIVKISEMEIQPGCTYAGQWHVEGFSSDNILYTCLYVIEHNENLVDGRLKFKRTPRSDDVPAHPYDQDQSAHGYCPDYTYLCDSNKVIPLGSLDLKENLMIIFPNQNIHKVKGIKNTTDKPLKRKIIAFFVVNHLDQPFTINDVEFTKPIEVIKENRLRDMYERSKNKQTESQEFNYCEH